MRIAPGQVIAPTQRLARREQLVQEQEVAELDEEQEDTAPRSSAGITIRPCRSKLWSTAPTTNPPITTAPSTTVIITARNRFTTLPALHAEDLRERPLRAARQHRRRPQGPDQPDEADVGSRLELIAGASPDPPPRVRGCRAISSWNQSDSPTFGSRCRRARTPPAGGEERQERGVREGGGLRAHVVDQALHVHLDRHLHRSDDARLHPGGEATELRPRPTGAVRSEPGSTDVAEPTGHPLY